MSKLISTKTGKFLKLSIALFFILIGIILRIFPHPFNFAPIVAIALFGGVYLDKKIAFVIPIIAMVISDIFIDFYANL